MLLASFCPIMTVLASHTGFMLAAEHVFRVFFLALQHVSRQLSQYIEFESAVLQKKP
jgi:hypothetical protein